MNEKFKDISDTTAALWDYRYLVRVPILQATSEDYLKQYGTYITGYKDIDRANANSMMSTYINIARMIELYQQGTTISIVNPQDTKKIYDAIEAHIEAWVHQLRYGLNIGNAPMQDLIDMDKFAELLYPYAKHRIPKEIMDSLLARNVDAKFRITPNKLFQRPAISTEPEEHKERESFADILKARVNQLMR